MQEYTYMFIQPNRFITVDICWFSYTEWLIWKHRLTQRLSTESAAANCLLKQIKAIQDTAISSGSSLAGRSRKLSPYNLFIHSFLQVRHVIVCRILCISVHEKRELKTEKWIDAIQFLNVYNYDLLSLVQRKWNCQCGNTRWAAGLTAQK